MQAGSGDADGRFMHDLARKLWPIHRSITGDGVRQTLELIHAELPDLVVHEVPSGRQAFDWIIPEEWTIRDARLVDPQGKTVLDLKHNNLHVVAYSEPFEGTISRSDLDDHLHSIPEQPTAIPFVTSYYHQCWGLCLTHEQREGLGEGDYQVFIDSQKSPGSLTFAELVIPGEVEDEVFLSTYVCHPSLANNELSGPVVAVALARRILDMPRRHFTYRIVFVPESIGALTYASLRTEALRDNVIAGFQLTCIGDDRRHTFIGSRLGDTRIDRLARRVVERYPNPVIYSYLARGSDERTYGSPGLDLPHVSVIRSRYGDYPEYHTSLDDLETVVTPSGLQGGLDAVWECLEKLETEPVLSACQIGEPQLGRRNLYHTLLNRNTPADVMLRTDVLAYADGEHSVLDIAELLGCTEQDVFAVAQQLASHGLLRFEMQRHRSRRGILTDVSKCENTWEVGGNCD